MDSGAVEAAREPPPTPPLPPSLILSQSVVQQYDESLDDLVVQLASVTSLCCQELGRDSNRTHGCGRPQVSHPIGVGAGVKLDPWVRVRMSNYTQGSGVGVCVHHK